MNCSIANWNEADHLAIYNHQQKNNPVWFDDRLNVWAVYRYEDCKAILSNPNANVPELNASDERLNETSRMLIAKLVRINNGHQHEIGRNAAFAIWQKLFRVDFGQLLSRLLQDVDTLDGFDWVEVVGKKLTILAITEGLGMDSADATYVSENLHTLVGVMSPVKTDEMIIQLNPVVERIYDIARRYTISQNIYPDSEAVNLVSCNLVGLFIQCYDGGRGLLTASLLNLVKCIDNNSLSNDPAFFTGLVNETLRLDAPVHNTRRVATHDIEIGGQVVKTGETILVVLAAANLDPEIFPDPLTFDPFRANSDRHLTFGLGGHNCLAKYFSISIAAGVCQYITENYPGVAVHQKEWECEPQLNVRLLKHLMVSLGRF